MAEVPGGEKMKVVAATCPKCKYGYLKVVLIGEFYVLMHCLYCDEKFRCTKEECLEKILEME
jgi:hypothetical protein